MRSDATSRYRIDSLLGIESHSRDWQARINCDGVRWLATRRHPVRDGVPDQFPTSARTALVETDGGFGYLKAMGGPEGPHTLAAEVVATQLAEWLGLPTFDCAIITIDQMDEIPFVDKNGN
jgi:hypothetical protein